VPGFLNRKLMSFFHLGPGDVVNLSFLYFATFIMRAAAFAGVPGIFSRIAERDPP